MPPPIVEAVLPLMVELVIVIAWRFDMPPPVPPAAVLPLIVLSVIVMLPVEGELRMPPPSEDDVLPFMVLCVSVMFPLLASPPPCIAKLSSITTLLSVSVTLLPLSKAPPLAFVGAWPFRSVRSLIVIEFNEPLVWKMRSTSAPSMMVAPGPSPSIVIVFVMSISPTAGFGLASGSEPEMLSVYVPAGTRTVLPGVLLAAMTASRSEQSLLQAPSALSVVLVTV